MFDKITIYFLKLCIIIYNLKKLIFYFFKSQFFKNTIPDNSYFTIWFKIVLFAYEIAMPSVS